MWRILIGCLCLWQTTSGQQSSQTWDKRSTDCPRQTLPTSCKDVTGTRPRVKAILFNGAEVLCDTQTDGGGWTVIQRRYDGSEDFNVGYYLYEYGFGSLDGEFWMGLKLMHRLTYKRCYQLRVEFRHNRQNHVAQYSYFKVHGPNDKFRLRLGRYAGRLYDALAYSNGQRFTAKDRDNDEYADGNCATFRGGGWWFDSCANANLNGMWSSRNFTGNYWFHNNIFFHGIQHTEMKIRPCN